MAEADAIGKRQREEDRAAHRRRMAEIFDGASARLRESLPGTENVLRSLVEALGSLSANANPDIVLADLVLRAWKATRTP